MGGLSKYCTAGAELKVPWRSDVGIEVGGLKDPYFKLHYIRAFFPILTFLGLTW